MLHVAACAHFIAVVAYVRSWVQLIKGFQTVIPAMKHGTHVDVRPTQHPSTPGEKTGEYVMTFQLDWDREAAASLHMHTVDVRHRRRKKTKRI